MVDLNNAQNPIDNSAVPLNQPQERHMNWKKVLMIGLLMVLVLVVLGIVLYYLYINKKELPPPPQVEKVRTEIRDTSFKEIDPDSTTETVFNYIDSLDAMLEDSSINETERMTLLLKKARVLATIRAGVLRGESAGDAKMNEALGILESLYMVTPENERQSRIRAGVIPIYLHLLTSSCFIPNTAKSLPDRYDDIYTDLTKDPSFSPKAAAILAFREFGYDALPPEYANDIVTVMWRDYLSAVYLHAFANKMTGAENDAREDEILDALFGDINNYGDLSPLLVTGTTKTEIEPLFYMAYAFDIASTFSSSTLSQKRKTEIGIKYEDALLAADTIEKDGTSKASIKILVAIYYLDSLYRLYGDDVDQKKVDELINVYIENFNYNTDTKTVFTSYLTEGVTPGGSWMPVRAHFYEIAKKNPKLRAFIAEKAGINL